MRVHLCSHHVKATLNRDPDDNIDIAIIITKSWENSTDAFKTVDQNNLISTVSKYIVEGHLSSATNVAQFFC